MYGRAEFSELDSVLEAWKSDGGDDSREFFEEAYKRLHGE